MYFCLHVQFLPLDAFASRVVAGATSGPFHSETAADLNNVVGDDSKSDPPLHAREASIAATTQSMSALQHADAALASGSPSLSSTEPTLFLNFLALQASGAPAGNRYSRNSHGLDGLLILQAIESSVGGHQSGHASQPTLMLLDRGD